MKTNKKYRVLGLIPARGGSKAIPHKNITMLAGKPLMGWVCEAAKAANLIDEIILSSDDEEIISVGKNYGINTPFKRPFVFARDDSLVVDVIHHALTWMKKHQDKIFDYVCLLQPTAPFVDPVDYDRAIQKAVDNDADTVISVYQCDQQHPAIMFTLQENGKADWFLENSKNRMARRQDLPPIYMRSGMVYVFKASMILEQRTLYGENLYAIDVPAVRGMIDINSPFDLKLAEVLLQEKLKNQVI